MDEVIEALPLAECSYQGTREGQTRGSATGVRPAPFDLPTVHWEPERGVGEVENFSGLLQSVHPGRLDDLSHWQHMLIPACSRRTNAYDCSESTLKADYCQ